MEPIKCNDAGTVLFCFYKFSRKFCFQFPYSNSKKKQFMVSLHHQLVPVHGLSTFRILRLNFSNHLIIWITHRSLLKSSLRLMMINILRIIFYCKTAEWRIERLDSYNVQVDSSVLSLHLLKISTEMAIITANLRDYFIINVVQLWMIYLWCQSSKLIS